MNPNELTLTLISGLGDGEYTACLMSARALLDGRGLTDRHPSRVIRSLGIVINDRSWWRDDAERTAVLMPVALDERLCASSVVATPEVERKRAYRCADMACRVWAPRALRAAGRMSDAERLESLAQVVDEQTAADAYAAALGARDAFVALVGVVVGAADVGAAADVAYAITGHAAYAGHAAAHVADRAAPRAARARAVVDAAGYAGHAVGVAHRSEAIALLLELCEVQS
jgi:hypothetical protein